MTYRGDKSAKSDKTTLIPGLFVVKTGILGPWFHSKFNANKVIQVLCREIVQIP